MKMLTIVLPVIGFTAATFAQGFIALDNIFNTSTSPYATANGLVFLCANNHYVLVNQDFNFAVYGGLDSANLVLIKSVSGAAAAGDNAAGPGTFIDLTGATYPIPGSSTQTSAFFRVQTWMGNYSSYNAALLAGAPVGQSSVFNNPIASPPYVPPDLIGMPAIDMGPLECPEPGPFAFTALSVLVWLARTRYRSQ